ncbi:imidazole glycerol phosphate synthase subunit HisH [Colwellia sp. 75C3]|uniref:imidazole glycerol phosphate synthase subunit HisH n=1 Tax=Colwellia sp. 75C3 TaxID=888425 RepID=UPI000C3343D4|nr:imidazole glycerol phosphate synthase subunit HisH [Colwellia sp. 75C3]PKG81123.1 imidazole glycerol phosphate synthase subunit HisH [Colwellia sp. 75C3]
MKIAIIDNKMGNIKSITNVLNVLNVQYYVATTPEELKGATGVILPGVGNFSAAAQRIKDNGFDIAIHEHISKNKPLLGICLGMQLLFEYGEEGGASRGLSLLPGSVVDLKHKIKNLPLPHVGWNDLMVKTSPLLADITTESCVYFVHCFEVLTDDKYVIATTHYGKNIVAAVQKNNIYGVQFHPEKSQKDGLGILKRFITLC